MFVGMCVAAGVAAGTGLFLGASVLAHAGLVGASPAPGATVGGEITEIELFYGSFIVAAEGSVDGPDGEPIASTFEMVSEIKVVATLDEPLSTPGEYAVRHTTTASDGDIVSNAYLFTYDPDAPPPVLVILEEDEGGGPPAWVLPVVVGVGAVVVSVLAWRLNRSVRRNRDSPPAT